MVSAEQAVESMRRNIMAVTGVPVAEWIRRTRASGFERHTEMVRWLRSRHGLRHGYAHFIARQSRASNEPSPR